MSQLTEAPMTEEAPTTESRKIDHIKINLEKNVQFPRLRTGFDKYQFMHQAIPEINLKDIDIKVNLLGKELSAPILISSMTGGADMAQRFNHNLAEVAQQYNIAMGVGSQRAALEDTKLAESFKIRHIAPDILLFANFGAVQLNYGYGIDHCRKAVEMIDADALILHFNVLQEAVQPEGDTNFAGLLDKVAEITSALHVPVIAKEVGWGFSEKNCRDLQEAGVAAIDVAGSGGTSWSEVERHRSPKLEERIAASFADWGIPTADAIQYAKKGAPELEILASGGIRDGIDIAKSIALGAKVGGLAGRYLKAANESVEEAALLTKELIAQIKISMLCSGASNIEELQNTPLYIRD